MIFDTTFLIDVLNGDPEDWRIALDEQGDIISVLERAKGADLSDRTDNERWAIMEFLSRLCVCPVDGELTLIAGELSAEPVDRGEWIEVEDVLVTATLHNETAVLTRTDLSTE